MYSFFKDTHSKYYLYILNKVRDNNNLNFNK